MAKSKIELYYSKLAIDADSIISYESETKEFEIEVYQGDANSPSEILQKRLTIPAEKKDDFVFKAQTDAIIGGLKVGNYYWFRIRVIKQNGTTSIWSSYYSERCGDSTNEIVFSGEEVISGSTAVTFRIATNLIPEDFSRFEWKVSTEVANLTDNPTTDKPVQPSYPDINAVADITTTATDDISISFTESREKWYHVWVRALDKSGNRSPLINNNWYYVGCGKIKNVDLQSDSDNEPPENTTVVTIDIDGINFL